VTDLRKLRQQVRAQRRQLHPREHARRSAAAAAQLRRHRLFRSARSVACYLANDGELDLDAVIQLCWALGKRVYLPVLSRIHHNHLHFLPCAPGEALVLNRYGIAEPRLRPRRMLSASQLDLVLLPLVGFDARGNRLGMGGGYYDRTFGFLRGRRRWRKPHLVGVGFDFQQVEQHGVEGLTRQPWDVPLEGVLSESGLRLFRRAG
jgi:5-formyltetrahydrofolate cyclo-ligase